MNMQSFLDRVSPEPNTGCWLWSGDATLKGYGVMSMGRGEDGKRVRIYAHRSGMIACHVCDTPACVNPVHIFLGTKADNSRDMTRKGRSTWGEKNPQAVLTEEQAIEAKRLLKTGVVSHQEIALMFGVCREAITAINRGLNWAYLGGTDARRR